MHRRAVLRRIQILWTGMRRVGRGNRPLESTRLLPKAEKADLFASPATPISTGATGRHRASCYGRLLAHRLSLPRQTCPDIEKRRLLACDIRGYRDRGGSGGE